MKRVPGHLDRQLLLAEDHLIRTGLLEIVGRVARVGSRHDAEALVRPARVLDDTARRLRIAERDHEKDGAVQMRSLENELVPGVAPAAIAAKARLIAFEAKRNCSRWRALIARGLSAFSFAPPIRR